MGQKILLVCGIVSMACALVVVVVGVIVANAIQQDTLAAPQTEFPVQQEAPHELPQPAEPWSQSDAYYDTQADSQHALEEDLAAQKEFQEGMKAAREEQENLQADIASDGQGKSSVLALQTVDTRTLVTVRTCSGGTIEFNAAEKRMLVLHNQTRKQRGLKALCVSPILTEAARTHKICSPWITSLTRHLTALGPLNGRNASVTPSKVVLPHAGMRT